MNREHASSSENLVVLRERPIPLELLRAAPRLFLLNSVRGLFPAVLDPSG